MNLIIKGLLNDLDIELPQIGKFYNEYREINYIFVKEEDKYERVLEDYGTEEFKFAVGFLTNIIKNIENKGYKVINSIFDAAESYHDLKLSVFYGNRILEKFNDEKEENILIRTETYRRILSILISLDDKLYFIRYLIDYSKQIKELLSLYPLFIKEIYIHCSDWYQFMYYYYLSISGDSEKAIGFIIKSYNIRKFLLDEGLTDIFAGNTIIFIANIIGLYAQLEDSLITLAIDPEEYIKEFLKEIKLLKEYLNKRPERKGFFLRGFFRKYYNELLTNIYVLGFLEEHKKAIEILPEIVNKDHLLMVKLDELYHKDIPKERLKEELQKIKNEMDIYFNNIPKKKQESLLYVYYNVLLEVENPQIVLGEIEEKIKKYKNSLILRVSKIKALKKAGMEEKMREFAEKVKEEAIIQNNSFIVNAVEKILSD